MKIWFDTEFIEDGKTIDLISIGLVREDGAELYLENAECDHTRADEWVQANVLPHLHNHEGAHAPCPWMTRSEIAKRVQAFAGAEPEFWAYYADYDWVVLCQLFGRMIDLPRGWPMYCRDLKQIADQHDVRLPVQNPEVDPEHHALADARWTRHAHLWLLAERGPRL